METYLNIALIIISVLLIVSVIMQSKGAGLGGLTGAESGTVFTARDATHARIAASLAADGVLPFGLAGQALLYAGPTPARKGGECFKWRAVDSSGPHLLPEPHPQPNAKQ